MQFLYSDKPIKDKNNDVLDRSTFAKELANAVLSITTEDSYTIGLYGEWGSGKTSILNMMEKEIESISSERDADDKPILLRFNPWDYYDSIKLTEQFFTQLKLVVEKKGNKSLRRIGKFISKYSSILLIPANLNGKYGLIVRWIYNIIEGFKKLFSADEDSVLTIKESIIDTLKKQKQRIIVIIDDIDRLSNEQICRVFRLVASVANFPKMTYILSFDKNIVANALTSIQTDNGFSYLEKIIQCPFEIPLIKDGKSSEIFLERIDTMLNENKDILCEPNYFNSVYHRVIYPFISNIRDINRVFNVLMFKYSLVKQEVNFADLVAISIIQTLHPTLYDWIVENKSILVGSTDNSGFLRYKNEEPQEDYARTISKLVGAKNAKAAYSALELLFPKLSSYSNSSFSEYVTDKELRANKRIASREKFDLYTQLSLKDISLSSFEIDKSLNEFDKTSLEKLFCELLSKGDLFYYFSEVFLRIDGLNSNRATVVFESIVSFPEKYIDKERHSLLSNSEDSAISIAKKLLQIINPEERANAILSCFNNLSIYMLKRIAIIINTIKLGYKDETKDRNDSVLVSDSELAEIENAFDFSVKKLISDSKESFLMNDDVKMICYVWSWINKAGFKSYLDKQFNNPINKCLFIIQYCSMPTILSGNIENHWVFSDEYLEYIDSKSILDAIQTCLNDKSFFKLTNSHQCALTAYYIWMNNKKIDEDERATVSIVRNQLEKWKHEYNYD